MGNHYEKSHSSGWNSFEERKSEDSMGARGDKAQDECFKCGGKGHFGMVCPIRDQKFTLICGEEFPPQEQQRVQNFPPLEEDKARSEDEIEEEILESSTLPVCVNRRILAGQRKEDKDEESWLRTNIFHTRVEHHGKAMNFIIDNGNGMNVASQETVQKL
jgi:hypothetical protein